MISIFICILLFVIITILFYNLFHSVADTRKDKIHIIIVSIFLSAMINVLLTLIILLCFSENTVKKTKAIETYDVSEETVITNNVVYSPLSGQAYLQNNN